MLQDGNRRTTGFQLHLVEGNRKQGSTIHIREISLAAGGFQITPKRAAVLQSLAVVIRLRDYFDVGVIYRCIGILGGEQDCFGAGQNLWIAMRAFFSLKFRNRNRVAPGRRNS